MNTPRVRVFFSILSLIAGKIASPEIACAAEESSKWGAWLDVGKFFNIILVIAILVWLGRKPLANFFVNRTQTIREQLEEAQKARKEAETKLAEIQTRMSRMDDEIREIKAAAEKEARDEYQRLLAAAEQDADKIIDRTRQEVEGLTRAAQQELKLHAAELSVKIAEERIRGDINNTDRERIFSQFVAKLGDKQ
jgi:F-type H+-transporting ATPase subunit b